MRRTVSSASGEITPAILLAPFGGQPVEHTDAYIDGDT